MAKVAKLYFNLLSILVNIFITIKPTSIPWLKQEYKNTFYEYTRSAGIATGKVHLIYPDQIPTYDTSLSPKYLPMTGRYLRNTYTWHVAISGILKHDTPLLS